MRLVAKHAEVGYVSPKDRPGCRNCVKLTDATPENGISLEPRPYCARHGIEVTPGAICSSHKPMPSPNRGSAADSRQRDLLDQVALPFPETGKFRSVGWIAA